MGMSWRCWQLQAGLAGSEARGAAVIDTGVCVCGADD
jgi:hypothetical protein